MGSGIYKYFNIYLLNEDQNPATEGSARINPKERVKKERQVRRAKKRKGIEAQKVEFPTPFRAIDALLGNEEQNGLKKQKTQNEREKDSILKLKVEIRIIKNNGNT